MALRRPLRYRGFSRPEFSFRVRVVFLVAMIAVSAWTLFAFVRGTVWAVQGEGDPEMIWPALGVLGVIAFVLSKASWRIGKRLTRDTS